MKMSKKYKALLLAGVLMTLGGNAFADSATWTELWNDNNTDTIINDLDINVGLIGRDDGHISTFAGGSITSVSTGRAFEAWSGSTLDFGTKDKPLTSFSATKTGDEYSAGVVCDEKSVVNIYADEYKQTSSQAGINVWNGGTLNISVGEFTSNTNDVGIEVISSAGGVLSSHATINAKKVDITSTNGAAVWIQNNTEASTAPEGASSLTITADKVNLKGSGWGVIAFSNSQFNLTGNSTIEGTNAIDVRGNSTVNINTDGEHTTVVKGDVVFETPNSPGDAQNSGKIINSYLNLNLTGADSSWTGKSYQEYKVDGAYVHKVELNVPPYYGNVTGFKLTVANGAAWNMTGDSFVNEATLTNGGAINVGKDVKIFNADKITMDGGVFDAKGGTSTISTLNASGDSTISLANAVLVAKAGTASLKSITACGKSSFTAPTNAVTTDTINVKDGAFIFSGGAVINNDLSVADKASITLTGDKALYTVGGKIASGGGNVILSGGTLTENNLTDKLAGTLEIKDSGILSTLSSQIYTNAAGETAKDPGEITNKNITYTGGTLELTDAKYTLSYANAAQAKLKAVDGKATVLHMSGDRVDETGEVNNKIGVDTIVENVDSDVELDKVEATAEKNLLIGTTANLGVNNTVDGDVKVEQQVESGFKVASLAIAKGEDNQKVGIVITNAQAVTLGGSTSNESLITVVDANGSALEEQPDVKVVIGTATPVTEGVKTAGTLNIGNSLATAETQYTLKGEAVVNSGSALNVKGQTKITKSVTLNEGTVAVESGSKLTTAALAVKAVGQDTSSSTLTGAAEVAKVTIDDNTVLNVGSEAKAGELVVKEIEGGMVFLDPAYADSIDKGSGFALVGGENADSVTINTALVAGKNSYISVGAELADAKTAFSKTGLTWGDDVSAVAYIGLNATLGDKGSLTVNGDLQSAPGATAGALTMAKDSLLMVDGAAVKDTAALSGVTSTSINAASTLYIDNAKKGETYKILASATEKLSEKWANDKVISSNALLAFTADTNIADAAANEQTPNVASDTAKNTYLNYKASVQSVKKVYGNDVIAPDVIDKATAGDTALNNFIMDKAVQEGVNSGKAAQASALNSAVALSEVAGAARATYTAAGLVNDAVADHMSIVHEYTHDKDVWAKYIHNKEDVDGLSIAGKDASYKNQYNGIVVGADVYHSDKATVGVALTYGDGNIYGNTLAAHTENDATYYGASIYGGIHHGNTAFLGDISYLHSKNDITQRNSGETITGTEKSNAFSIGVRAERSLKAGEGQFVPYVGLRYMHLSNGSYTDSLGLSHDGGDMNLWLLPVGVKYSMDAKHGSWTLRPIAEIGYVWNMGDRDATETVSFDGTSSSFGYDVADSGSYLGRLGFEAEKGNTTFGIGYQYQKGDNVKSNRWSASVNYRF